MECHDEMGTLLTGNYLACNLDILLSSHEDEDVTRG